VNEKRSTARELRDDEGEGEDERWGNRKIRFLKREVSLSIRFFVSTSKTLIVNSLLKY